MSAIALAWVATVKVGNQTAKQLLQFYASHNFNKPGFEFKTSTLAEQLEVSERAIYAAHKFLVDKNLIKRVPQYGKDGSQLNTITYLEIPNEFVDNFFKRGGGDELRSGGGCSTFTPRGEVRSPLNNNINNKHNKREPEPKKAARQNRSPVGVKRLPLPNDFVFDDENMARCREKGLDPSHILAKFKAYSRSSGKKSDDWQSEARLWIEREWTEVKNKPMDKPVTTRKEEDYSFSHIKPASPQVVNENMKKIRDILPRMVIKNGNRLETKSTERACD